MALDIRTLVWLVLGRNAERKPRRTESRRGPSRDSAYRAWIRTLSCSCCGSRWQIEAAHTGSEGGMSQKASDFSCVPLCRDCHTAGREAYHRIGKLAFERKWGIDFFDLVRALNIAWTVKKSHAHEDAQAEERYEALGTEPTVPFVDETQSHFLCSARLATNKRRLLSHGSSSNNGTP